MNQRRKTIDTLFAHFEKGEWDEIAPLFADEAQIIQHFGQDTSAQSIATFIENGKNGPLSKVGNPVYLERRVSLIGTTGFVEQHITQLNIREYVFKLPVCIVGQFDTNGKITLLEEYLDPSPLAVLFR